MPARFDAISDYYERGWGNEAIDETALAVLQLIGNVERLRVLDIACGHGRLSRELARRGASVVGLDISEQLLALARQIEEDAQAGIDYRQGDVSSSSALSGEVFDAVSCNFGLTDIDDLSGAIATVSRVLRPGGEFVFSILHPCFPGWDADAPSAWPPDRGYFQEGWWLAESTGLRGMVGSNFRKLSTYFNALIIHRLAIDSVVEPEPPAHFLERLPGAAPVPYTLVVRCIRRLT